MDALRQLESKLTELLGRIPDAAVVSSPYVAEYEKAVDHAAELGIDADRFRVSSSKAQAPGAHGAEARKAEDSRDEHEVQRIHLLSQIASLGSYVRNLLKRGRGPMRGGVDPQRS